MIRIRGSLSLALVAALAACKGTEPRPQAAVIIKITGDGQSAQVGTQLAQALVVQVNDVRGRGVPGVEVSFQVTLGGGSLSGATGPTGGDGRSSIAWTLGTASGTAHQVTVTAGSAPATTFSATATAGPAADVVAHTAVLQYALRNSAVGNPPAVRVRDQYGNGVPSRSVTFEVLAGAGGVTGGAATTDASGVARVGSWTVGSSGDDSLTATVTGVPGSPVKFAASLAGGTVAVFEGNNQQGLRSFPVNVAPAVVVRDTQNNPLAGVPVDFAVASGGGSVAAASTTTDANGVARVGSWTVQLGTNTLTASAGGAIAGTPLTFTAQAFPPAYNIDIRYLATPTVEQRVAFDSAKARWERTIWGDVADIFIPGNNPIDAGTCGPNSPAIANENIDDVIIFVTLEPIDGAGGVLGQAGPCYIRLPSDLSLIGLMRFDTADLEQIRSLGLLDELILHEMGHVLGFGALWVPPGTNPGWDLLVDPSQLDGTDPHFIGPLAIRAFDESGGSAYTAGAKVPVEGLPFRDGTSDSHWRESVLDSELMTGFIDAGLNPLSRISIASIADGGYLTNFGAADPYAVPDPAPAAALRQGPVLELKDDVLRLPIYAVDRVGRVVRVLMPR